MGAYQNKAVRLARVISGNAAVTEHDFALQRLTEAFSSLYLAAGGLPEDFQAAMLRAAARMDGQDIRVDQATGEILQSLAVFGHIHDIDIIQAGYNTMDAQVRAIRERAASRSSQAS